MRPWEVLAYLARMIRIKNRVLDSRPGRRSFHRVASFGDKDFVQVYDAELAKKLARNPTVEKGFMDVSFINFMTAPVIFARSINGAEYEARIALFDKLKASLHYPDLCRRLSCEMDTFYAGLDPKKTTLLNLFDVSRAMLIRAVYAHLSEREISDELYDIVYGASTNLLEIAHFAERPDRALYARFLSAIEADLRETRQSKYWQRFVELGGGEVDARLAHTVASELYTIAVNQVALLFGYALYSVLRVESSSAAAAKALQDEAVAFSANRRAPTPTLSGVLHETLRVVPISSRISRTITEPLTHAGHTFPPGTDFFYSTALFHRTTFGDAETFSPVRWDVEPDKALYIPFGHGHRACRGIDFTHHITKVMLASWMQHIDFGVSDQLLAKDIQFSKKDLQSYLFAYRVRPAGPAGRRPIPRFRLNTLSMRWKDVQTKYCEVLAVRDYMPVFTAYLRHDRERFGRRQTASDRHAAA